MEKPSSTSSWSETGPWRLPIDGFEVMHMGIGAFVVDIFAYGEPGGQTETHGFGAAPSAMLRFEGEFQLIEPDGESLLLDPSTQEWSALTPLFALRRNRVASAVASSDGHLEVSFTSGRRLVAGPHPDYENWEAHGPGFQMFATPGGGVAIF